MIKTTKDCTQTEKLTADLSLQVAVLEREAPAEKLSVGGGSMSHRVFFDKKETEMQTKILKIISLILVIVILTGCGSRTEPTKLAEQDEIINTIDTPDIIDAIETADIIGEVSAIESASEESDSEIHTEVFDDMIIGTKINTDVEIRDDTDTETRNNTILDVNPIGLKAPEENNKNYDSYLWVGDSRIVQMAGCVNITYIAESGMGLDWLRTVADTVYSYRNCNVIFSFGGNDLGNAVNYASFYNNMPEDFIQNNNIFIMALNPVDESMLVGNTYLTNANFEWYNANLKANLRDDFYWIESYDYLTDDGFNTTDGLHYDYDTYVKIYNFTVECVQNTLDQI